MSALIWPRIFAGHPLITDDAVKVPSFVFSLSCCKLNCSTEPSVTRFIVPWYVEPSFGIEGAVEVGLDAGIDVGADGTDVGAGGVGGGGIVHGH